MIGTSTSRTPKPAIRNTVLGEVNSIRKPPAANASACPAGAAVPTRPKTRPSISRGTDCWTRVSIATTSTALPTPAIAWPTATSAITGAIPVSTAPIPPATQPRRKTVAAAAAVPFHESPSEPRSIPTPYAPVTSP